MSKHVGWRMRLAALGGLFALVAALAVVASGQASAADGPKVWVGPAAGCPAAGGWECHASGPITQNATGATNEIHCVADTCTGLSQTNTTGDNIIVCDQSVHPADAAAPSPTVQTCSGSQTNSGGNNKFDIGQAATLNTPDPTVATSVSQDSTQGSDVTQSTTGAGSNHLGVTQGICETGNTNVNAPAQQDQEARQKLIVHKQTSEAGNQDITVNQTQACGSNPLSATVGAPQVVQNQNAQKRTGDVSNQYIDIGPGSEIGMITNTGSNKLIVNQIENFRQTATGLGGTDTLAKATQTQGSSLPPAVLNWRIDALDPAGCSDPSAGVTALQKKTWTQDASPNATILGTKSQTQNDDPLQIVGRLHSTCRSSVTQNATLKQQGTAGVSDFHKQVCEETQDVSNKITGTGTQNCANNTTVASNSGSGTHWNIATSCTNSTCQKSGVTVSPANISAVEGAPFSGQVGTFTDAKTTDAASDFSASIDWGDGNSSSGSISGSSGTFTVSGAHTYGEEGGSPLAVTVTNVHDSSITGSAKGAATVGDAKLTGSGKSLSSPGSVSGVVASFTDANPGEPTSDYSASIDWGDGSAPSAGTITANGSSFDVSGSHTYGQSGPYTITVSIADVGRATATATSTFQGYQYLAHGSFSIGDRNAAVGSAVTWWGGQWSSANSLSGGPAPSSFKGYENTVDRPACGVTWSTTTGNSPPPPSSGLPKYMATIVTSKVTGGSTPSGTTVHMVIVDTTGTGYAPDPSHPGTGKVVGVIC